ncbi:MAG: cupin domain-containing protein [Rhodobiaceae bacterium]|nr:cupin domain-containing protein [Rhodobiaceae bacterium]
MMAQLGTLEELPLEYREALAKQSTGPLWPMMRNVLPHDRPSAISKPHLWSYEHIRPLLLRAGELTPVEKAERRVLVLADPGRGEGAMQVTSSIYCGLQLLLPGEKAPAHKHTPSAARIIVEGEGAYTIVDGEKCVMQHGDLVLTPGGMWHDHGHEGDQPVIWLDALDLPLFVYLEGSYAVEGEFQTPRNRPDSSMLEYAEAGLVPTRAPGSARAKYPQLRYPWSKTRAGLEKLAAYTDRGRAVELDYVNPETGEPCLPTMGFTAMMLAAGDKVRAPVTSSSNVFHVIDGAGSSTVNGKTVNWKRGDTFSAPVFSEIDHQAGGKDPAFLIRIHDRPLQEKIGFYEERGRA